MYMYKWIIKKHVHVTMQSYSIIIHVYILIKARSFITYHYIERLHLTSPESFHYLNQSGCVSDPTINDVADFARVRVSL